MSTCASVTLGVTLRCGRKSPKILEWTHTHTHAHKYTRIFFFAQMQNPNVLQTVKTVVLVTACTKYARICAIVYALLNEIGL